MDNWIVYGSESPGQPNFNDALNTTTRRHHSKSRKGCKTCKQRRIKCDETQPACRQCVDYGRHCSFLDSLPPPPPPTTGPQSTAQSFEDIVDQVWTKLQRRRDKEGIPDIALRRPYVRLILDHFLHREDEWLLGMPFQSLVQIHGLRIGLESEYVLHAILAVTACHMHYEDPSNVDLHLISHCHYSLALELYQERLNNIRPIDLDPIYLCGMVQIIMTIRYTLLDVATGPELLSGYDILLTAIKTMNSFPALINPFRGFREVVDSLFYGFFTKCNFPDQIGSSDQVLAQTPFAIAPLEGLIRTLTGDSQFESTYQQAFSHLVSISNQEARLEDLDTGMAFSSQLKDGYLEALESREPVAILLLCYWFALLSRIKQWWITDPARTFCERFYVYLSSVLPLPMQERTMLLSPAAQALGWA